MCRTYVITALHCSFSIANLQLLFAGIETENAGKQMIRFSGDYRQTD